MANLLTTMTARQRLKSELQLMLQIELREIPLDRKKITKIKKQLENIN